MSVKFVLTSGLLLTAAMAHAAKTDDLTFSAGLSYENSDNITLSPVDRKSDSIVHTLLGANYHKKSARIDANFNLNADNLRYQKHTFTNRTTVSSDFTLGATLERERLYWDVNNRLARVQINQAAPNIPTNQENTNYFMTGPRFVFFKNNKHSLKADLRYEKFYTQISHSDYSGYIFDTAYHRNITRTAAMDLAVKYNDRIFDDQLLNTNYKRTDVTLDLSKQKRLSNMDVAFGKTFVQPDDKPGYEETIFRANYNYHLRNQAAFNAGYSRALSDFSNTFASATSGTTTYTNVSGITFLQKTGHISLVRNFSRSSLKYDYLYSSNSYDNTALDMVVRSSRLSLNNKIGIGLNLNLSAMYRDSSFSVGNRVDLARVYNLSLTQRFLNSYDLNFSIGYTHQGSTDSNYSYDERRISVGGNYYFR